ncbi:MAG: transposase [Thermomicrobiales bacterium]
MVESTPSAAARPLLPELWALLAASRPAFRQERTHQRSVALVLGWLSAFGRHTVTGVLLVLGMGAVDWTAWHRLFSRGRIDYDQLTTCVLGQTLDLSAPTDPYLVGVDATQIARHSRTMPGTTWLRHLGTAIFRPGLHRAQRFVHLAWLPLPSPTGYSRAVPLRFVPAFPPKAVPVPDHPPRKEWEAGVAALRWRRVALDGAGRTTQRVLALGDGAYSTASLWAALPDRVTVLARCAKNRALFALPPAPAPGATGRPRRYGERQPRPDAVLALRSGWRRVTLTVRGRQIPIQFRVAGPLLVHGAPDQPLFLLVVKGSDPARGKRKRVARFFLVSAVADGTGDWTLPWPAADLLAWAWQRWELEVAHRELKTTFGLGEPQAWSPVAAVLTVQWAAWVYAILVLAGVRAWGLGPGPVSAPGRWWGGSGRWSLARLWHGLRQELWQETGFHRVCSRTGDDWGKMADWVGLKTNAALTASHT